MRLVAQTIQVVPTSVWRIDRFELEDIGILEYPEVVHSLVTRPTSDRIDRHFCLGGRALTKVPQKSKLRTKLSPT